MRQVFHAHIAPDLLALQGLWNQARLGLRLNGVIAIRLPFRFREGEPATFIVTDNDLNIAATLRQKKIVEKILVTVLPTHIGLPTWNEAVAAQWAYNVGGPDFEIVIRKCFQNQALGSPQAFDPTAFQMDPNDTVQIASLQAEIDDLKRRLQAVAPSMNHQAAIVFINTVRVCGYENETLLRSFLADAMNGQFERERFVLLTALRYGIVQDLVNARKNPLGVGFVSASLAVKLTDSTGIAAGCATWAVDTWSQVV